MSTTVVISPPVQYQPIVVNTLHPDTLKAVLNEWGRHGWHLGPSDIENGLLILWREVER